MRIVICALGALLLAGCAVSQPVPTARPLNASQIAALGPTPVAFVEANEGVTKSWVAQNFAAAGASQGLLGVLVGAAMDAIVNYAPSRRAGRVADELAEIMPAEALDTSLATHLQQQISTPEPNAIVVSEVRTVQRLTEEEAGDDTVEIATSYVLSEDATALNVVFTVSYLNPAVPYATPYTFDKAPPREELTGPTYRNQFTYRSNQLPVPVLTPEMRERLVASIQDSARDETGALPAEGSDPHKAMLRELESARDDTFTKDEISIFLAREWTRDDGGMLRQAIEEAHAFVARYLVIDLNRTAIPSLTGTDEIVETMADGRTVRRIGSTLAAGSYVSLPGNVTDFVTFGNTNAVAGVNRDRANAIRAEARAARTSR